MGEAAEKEEPVLFHVGQDVALAVSGTFDSTPSRKRVVRVFARAVELDDGTRWHNDSGKPFGKTPHSRHAYITPWTADHDIEVLRRELGYALMHISKSENVRKLTGEQVKRLLICINELGIRR